MIHMMHEQSLGADRVVGVDEVGYGAWAGPIGVASAYVHPTRCPQDFIGLLKDSKKLSPKNRSDINAKFFQNPHWGEAHVTWVNVAEIVPGNALRQTLDAMVKAVKNMSFRVHGVVVDGKHKLPLDVPQIAVCGADDQSASVALASIVAKVARDRLMHDLHAVLPMYGWNTNVGYGTATHRLAISLHGLSVHHRPHYCARAFL